MTDTNSAGRERASIIQKQLRSVSNTFKVQWTKKMLAKDPTSPRPTCYVCAATFTRVMTLEGHLNAHAGLKQYQCESCDKAFVRKRDLVEHERHHRDTQLHICQRVVEGRSYGCGWHYSRKTTLNRHWKSRTGEMCLLTPMPAHTVPGSQEELEDLPLINQSLEEGNTPSMASAANNHAEAATDAVSTSSKWYSTGLSMTDLAQETLQKLENIAGIILQSVLQTVRDNARQDMSEGKDNGDRHLNELREGLTDELLRLVTLRYPAEETRRSPSCDLEPIERGLVVAAARSLATHFIEISVRDRCNKH